MFDSADVDGVANQVASLTAGVDGLLGADLSALSEDALLDLVRAVEVQRRRQVMVDAALLAEVEARGVAGSRGCRATADLLVLLLRIDPGEARSRVRAAAELGPRRELSGAPLEPLFPATAQAGAAGVISAEHARLITSTVWALPDAVAAEKDREVEGFLVEQAALFEPRALALIARRLRETLDPDGILADENYRHRTRELAVHQRPDGSARVTGELTALCAEALLAVLDSLSRPHPATDGTKDPRSHGQRRHDGLDDACRRLLGTEQLPAVGGVAATILITMTAEQATPGPSYGTGLARTGHGALIPAATALTLAGDAQTQAVAFAGAGPLRRIEAYSSTQRIFTQQQRLAMTARDGGCCFPGCTIPAAWCQAQHVTEHAITGHTRVDDGALLCGYHHREYQRLGYTNTMINGIPHWTPPTWIDPTQTPQRNTAHHPQDALTRRPPQPAGTPTGTPTATPTVTPTTEAPARAPQAPPLAAQAPPPTPDAPPPQMAVEP